MFLNPHYRKRLSAYAAAAAMVLAAAPQFVHAETAEGRIENRHSLPVATLSAQVFETVAQDTVTITLAVQFSDAKQDVVTRKLTQTLDSVMKQAKADSNVKASSGNYRIWPHTDKQGAITNWRGSAEVVLESSDFDAASLLASKLSDRMPIASMGFSVSQQLRAEREQALLADAAKAFQARAQTVTQAFGYTGYRIKTVDVGGGGGYYPPSMVRMGMAASGISEKVADVPVEPGTETINLSMQGSIFLLDKK